MMDANNLFNWYDYMEDLTTHNQLCVDHHYVHTICSGIGYLEGMLHKFRSATHFVCTTDTSEESTFETSGGFFKRRILTAFILARYNPRAIGDYATKMSLCREIFRQFHSRFLMDSLNLQKDMLYLNVRDIRSKEFGGTMLNSCTGLYFQLSIDEPINLRFNHSEWITDKTEPTKA